MGQNMVGWVRLRAQGPSGTKVVLRFAETLKADGTIYTDNLRRARATDTYILKGNNEENWEPKFTYHGFRYVEISGFPGVPSKDAILGKVVHSAAPPTIAFNCSNELINRIQKNIVWGQRGNMHSVPTDCPQRDERLGWMGDAQIFAPTASYNMNMARFWRKWVRDIADCQEEDGSVHDVNPAIVVRGPAKPGWGDAVVAVPWVTYHFYGDKRIIEENFDAMAGWVRYMENNSKDYLYERTGYGDWISVVPSPKEPIGAAYFYYSTKLLSEMAGIIGRNDDQIKYLHLSEKIAAAFQKKYYNPQTGQYTGETQTANLLPLAFGITPPSERQRVADNIAGNVRDRGKHPSTGFLGTSYLLPVLSQYGAHPLAYETASQTTYPSWGYMVEKGATTMWELWNSDVAGPGMNSRNHFALGCVGEWFYSRLAGIYPDPNFPGFKQFIIAPKPAGDLTFTEMQLETGYGRISSRWQIADSTFTLDVTIPANTSALVYLPSPEGKKATIAANGVTILVDGTMGKMSEGLTVLSKTDTETGIRAGAGQYHFVVK
ncbi:MAG: alpha-L-rhamnosidase, partial [Calditrichales bacterium]